MDSVEHLKRLYRFNDWANRIVLRSLRESNSEKANAYLAHVLVTENEYFERLYGKDSTGFDFWPEMSLDGCSQLAQENAARFEKLLDGFDENGLGQTVSYKTSEGEAVSNTFREVLTHVLFHSMNHRGQILTALRSEGFEPPSIDYIIFERTIK